MDPENAFCPSIVSHNASTHNVLLKVTVPKRTGRKRKRGTNGPWEGDATLEGDGEQVSSHRRLDHPKTLLRKLQDNVDSYRVETAGVIKHTHRYRGSCSSFSQRSRVKLLTCDFSFFLKGLMDFQIDLGKSEFATNFVDKVLSSDSESSDPDNSLHCFSVN